MSLSRLTDRVMAVCPIKGIRVSKQGDPPEVEIQFLDRTTDAERAAALEVVASHDWNAALVDEDRREVFRQVARSTFFDYDGCVMTGVRAMAKTQWEAINEVRRACGLPELGPDEVERRMAELIDAGAADARVYTGPLGMTDKYDEVE